MYRTHDKSQRFEEYYDKLMSKENLCMRFFVTATPVPVLLALAEDTTVDDIKFERTEPCKDYLGVTDMEPFKDAEGSAVFLEQGMLSHNAGVCFKNREIPFTNEDVMELYKDAAFSKKSNVLLLDITCNRVNVEGNVVQKAELVQRYIKAEGADIAVVLNIGAGIRFRLPHTPKGQWIDCGKGLKISEVLDSIRSPEQNEEADDEPNTPTAKPVPYLGPIFVFGFSLMRRGISYRSSTDVPTHIALHMGQGHHIENIVQAVGRATFIGKGLLHQNGHEHVKALMTREDWRMVRAYQRYVEEIDKRVSLQESVFEAMSGALRCLPDCTNYLQHTQRRTGLRAKSQPNAFDEKHNPSFETPASLADDEKDMIKWYADPEHTAYYKIAYICYDLAKGKSEFEAEDIVEAYNDQFRDDESFSRVTKTGVTTALRKHIVKDRLVQSKPGERKSTKRYSVGRFNNRLAKVLFHARGLRRHDPIATDEGRLTSQPVKVEDEEEEQKKRKHESTLESGPTMDPDYEIGGKYQRIGL